MDLIKVAEQAFLVEKTHPVLKAGIRLRLLTVLLKVQKNVFKSFVAM